MWAALAPIIKLILEALLGVLIDEASKPDSAVVADRESDAFIRLRRKLHAYTHDIDPGGDPGDAG